MKLVHSEIDTVFYFESGEILSLVIEDPAYFYHFVNELYRQTCGDDGKFTLSLDDKPIKIDGNLDLLTDFFPFEINKKTVLTKIVAKLEKQSQQPEFYEQCQQLLAQIEKLVYDLAFTNDLEVEMPKLTISALLKSIGLCLKEEYHSLAEKLLVYMDLMVACGFAKVFVFVNLRSIIADREMELFAATCCSKEYRVLLLDNREYPKFVPEKRTVIDVDKCEI